MLRIVRRIWIRAAALWLLCIPVADISAQSREFETAKMMEIQTAVLRSVEGMYVDSVDIGKMIETGINSMLASLDPYTVFIPEEEEEDLTMMTTGSYGGVGSVIKKTPSGEVLISEPYAGSPAVKFGLQPGDLILEIEGQDVRKLKVDECSARMRGTPGTVLNMKVLKARTRDTVKIELVREKVHQSDVQYSGFVNDTTGYIQIGSFTLGGSEDVRKALEALRESGKMKQLVLDLRNNGGGLLSEAINILSMFVPKGTLVLTQRGKLEGSYLEARTVTDPVDTELPIIVMVNSASASSSEIVTGAIQDLDRGIVAGTRTYGKGLVQSIRSTGYGSSLKITTAKYYTPSGRCVQAIDYSHRNEDGSVGSVPDSLKKEFHTAGGRSVFDGGGITPDLELETKYYSRPMVSFIYSDIMNDYSIKYFTSHDSVAGPGEFSLSDEEYQQFVAYASGRDFDARTESQIEMEQILKTAEREGMTEDVEGLEGQMKELLAKVTLSKEDFLRNYKDELLHFLEEEIMTKYYYGAGAAQLMLRYDEDLLAVLEKVGRGEVSIK